MKPHHATALALVGWYLMLPPRVSDWPTLVFDTNAPLSKWQQGGSFDTAKECDEDKKKDAGLALQLAEKMSGEDKKKAMLSVMRMLSGPQCIASDDPRLKER
jgi:hypothetical protein